MTYGTSTVGSLPGLVTHKRDENKKRTLRVLRRAAVQGSHFSEVVLLVAVLVLVAGNPVSSQQMIGLTAVIELMESRVQKKRWSPIPGWIVVDIERRVCAPVSWNRLVLMERPSDEAVSEAASCQLVVGKVRHQLER